MQINRRFVPEGTDPFLMFKYVSHDVRLIHHNKKGLDGQPLVIYEQKSCEVPEAWSNNARNTLVSKYFRKAGVPIGPSVTYPSPLHTDVPSWLAPTCVADGSTFGGETSIKQVVHRIVGHWTFTGFKQGYFNASESQKAQSLGDANITSRHTAECKFREANAKAFYDEMVYMLLNQMAAPNSPQWFNTGLWWAYGITGPAQGHWFVHGKTNTTKFAAGDSWHRSDVKEALTAIEKFTQLSPNAYERVQAHACYIMNVEDTMFGDQGIYEWFKSEARIFKFGSGAGTNLSKLRGAGEKLSGGGKSSGMMSWARISDTSAGAIKSGGVTRRAAKMLCLDLDHPDILEFINCKVDAELKVAAMHVGSKAVDIHCQNILVSCQKAHDSLKGCVSADMLRKIPIVRDAMQDAAVAGVPHNYIDRAVLLGSQGMFEWPGEPLTLGYEDDAYATVPWQNGNNSVRVPSSFYEAVDNRQGWGLTRRTDGSIIKTVPARELEDAIAYAAWFSADPGVQFDTTYNDWNVTPDDGRINGTNPCSEHARLDNSACNLASLRLTKFYVAHQGEGTEHSLFFDTDAYTHAVDLWMIALDITNTMAHLPEKASAISVYMYRDTGLGYADLGSLLMSMGMAYDSEVARDTAAAITSIHQAQCHVTSAKMAEALGAYPRFYANKEHHLRCVRNHMRAARADPTPFEHLTVTPVAMNGCCPTYLYAKSQSLWHTAYAQGLSHGYRNAEQSVIAPTGTIAIVMDCDTTGIEPMLGLVIYKTLAGGGTMVIEPANAVRMGLRKLGKESCLSFLKEAGWLPDQGHDDGVGKDGLSEHELSIFDTSFPDAHSGRSIAWEAHVKMMAACQAFISGSISKTVNMPYTATVQDIKAAYRMSHDLGVKSISVYRFASKLSQPLNIPGLDPSDVNLSDPVDTAVTEAEEPSESVMLDVAGRIRVLLEEAQRDGKLTSPIHATTRVRLPSIRTPGIDISVQFGPGNLYVRTTRYDDGKLGEVWIEYSADQGLFSAMMKQLCKLMNVAIQFGVPTDVILKTMIESKFEPNGPVGGHPYIKFAPSVISLAARLIAYHEYGDTTVLTIQPKDHLSNEEVADVVATVKEAEASRGIMDIVGPVTIASEGCPECGSKQFTVSGAGCKKCSECGHAGGCG